jgi:hypothetical protein
VVEVSGSRLGKVVGTWAVIGGGIDGTCRWPGEAGTDDTFTAEMDSGSAQGRSRMRPH